MFISSKDTETPSSSKTNHENDEQEKETNRQGDEGNDEDIELLINYPEKVAPNFPCQVPLTQLRWCEMITVYATNKSIKPVPMRLLRHKEIRLVMQTSVRFSAVPNHVPLTQAEVHCPTMRCN